MADASNHHGDVLSLPCKQPFDMRYSLGKERQSLRVLSCSGLWPCCGTTDRMLATEERYRQARQAHVLPLHRASRAAR